MIMIIYYHTSHIYIYICTRIYIYIYIYIYICLPPEGRQAGALDAARPVGLLGLAAHVAASYLSLSLSLSIYIYIYICMINSCISLCII